MALLLSTRELTVGMRCIPTGKGADGATFKRLRAIFKETPDCRVLTFEGEDGEVYADEKLWYVEDASVRHV